MVEATLEMGRGYWAGAARALRAWLDLDPPANDPTFAGGDWAVQRVGAAKLLEQIERLLLTHSPMTGFKDV